MHHTNLFAHYESANQVYEALQRDYKRDVRQLRFMDMAIVAAIFFLARHLAMADFIAAVGLVAVAMTRLNVFIDNSNRNFLLHAFDWLAARDRFVKQEARPR